MSLTAGNPQRLSLMISWILTMMSHELERKNINMYLVTKHLVLFPECSFVEDQTMMKTGQVYTLNGSVRSVLHNIAENFTYDDD
jgi:hypothetical protein